jgi:hypothetical protein
MLGLMSQQLCYKFTQNSQQLFYMKLVNVIVTNLLKICKFRFQIQRVHIGQFT